MLFTAALRYVPGALGVRSTPLPKVIQGMGSPGFPARKISSDEALRAAQRACSRWARWFGGLDSCLTRSLVAGALLAGSHEVVLHVGFRPTDQGSEAVDGHAWLVVDGEVVELTGLDHEHGEPYESTLELPMG